ncbi:hypothetical protein D1007_28703 [Hordeum vulgare]|nr:hypothetical protein D1007_28703 [Hordeum vulgare]
MRWWSTGKGAGRARPPDLDPDRIGASGGEALRRRPVADATGNGRGRDGVGRRTTARNLRWSTGSGEAELQQRRRAADHGKSADRRRWRLGCCFAQRGEVLRQPTVLAAAVFRWGWPAAARTGSAGQRRRSCSSGAEADGVARGLDGLERASLGPGRAYLTRRRET